MAVAKAKGRLRGKKPKLSPHQEAHLVELQRPCGADTGFVASCSTVNVS